MNVKEVETMFKYDYLQDLETMGNGFQKAIRAVRLVNLHV